MNETSRENEASDREKRLEKKISNSAAKIAKIEAQLDANRKNNRQLTDEKLEYQANCRAAQERAAHAEEKISEMITRNTILEDEIKQNKTNKQTNNPRDTHKDELKQGTLFYTFFIHRENYS